MPEGARIYNLFPLLAGSIDEWPNHLERIAGMGFNWIYLNPIHLPGFSGSLYAVKDYYSLNPLLRGGASGSPDELMADFCRAAKARGIQVMMDLVVNHTGKDSVLVQQHPEWFEREHDGQLHSPFCVDPLSGAKTVWADLAEINYREGPHRQQILDYFCQVIDHYVRIGFAGFRCDAAYKVAREMWQVLIGAGRRANPETLFIAENLGAMMEQVEQLRGAGFDYLFNSAKWWDFRQPWLLEQYEKFRSIAPSIAFPETHDTARLAAELADQGVPPDQFERRYRTAYLFSALFSSGVMIPIGFEYGFRKRLHVVSTRPSDWERPAFDLTGFIAEVNRMKASLPILNEEGPQRYHQFGDGRLVGLVRRPMRGQGWVFSLVNADPWNEVRGWVGNLDGDVQGGREVTPGRASAEGLRVGQDYTLAPGEIRVFASS
jgi:starch synthase (maltosyl-transferring)